MSVGREAMGVRAEQGDSLQRPGGGPESESERAGVRETERDTQTHARSGSHVFVMWACANGCIS